MNNLFNRTVKPGWVPPGEITEVGAHLLPRGMFYVGHGLKSVTGKEVEPALIDPGLPVDRHNPSKVFRWSPEVTGYTAIGARIKALYLNWLAGGRKDLETSTGCLMLFLFGIERRVLNDIKEDAAVYRELPAITSELERLLNFYGDKHSAFAFQARSLLEYLDTLQTPVPSEKTDWTSFLRAPTESRALPRDLKIILGQVALQGNPIPAELAYAWFLHAPGVRRRDPEKVCPEQHQLLFFERYAELYGEGLVLEGTYAKLASAYTPVSPTFGRPIGSFEAVMDVPDITRDTVTVRHLEAVADYCDTALNEYARLMRAEPEKRQSLEALALLPKSLWPAGRRYPLEKAVQAMTEDGRPYVVPYSKVQAWLPRYAGHPQQRQATFQRALKQWALNIEPEALDALEPEAPVVLFFQQEDQRERALPGEYPRACLAYRLLLFIVRADGGIQGDEYAVLRSKIVLWPELNTAERARLAAYICWLQASPRTLLDGAVAQLKALDARGKARIGEFLLTVADAIGMAGMTLARILAQISVQADKGEKTRKHLEPVAVAPSRKRSSRYAVPKPPQAPPAPPPKPKVVLDMAKIAQLQADSAAVNEMLAPIFETEEAVALPPPPGTPVAPAEVEKTLLGLDAKHSAFTRLLCSQARWSRKDLQTHCTRLGLLLDGALERVNEAAFDRFDDPLTEGDDPVELNATVAKEIVHDPD